MNEKHTPTSEIETMTRKQVAMALGISVSSVRRLEGDTLHPVTDEQGIRRFDTAEVMALAPQIKNDEPPQPTNEPPENLSKGEIAARAFECFEQRQAMSEIIISLQVEPSVIAKLHSQWQTGFGKHPQQALLETLTSEKATDRLGDVDEGTRISVARLVRDVYDEQSMDMTHQEFSPLVGFIADGPITVQDLRARYGTGKHRISAYDLQQRRLRWEIVTSL